jgi:hypothetical protein
VLPQLTYLGVTNAFALHRLLPISDHDKDAEILLLRHQISVLQQQLAPHTVRFAAADRALLAALLHRLHRPTLRSCARWYVRTPSRAGTVTYSPDATPPDHAPNAQADRAPPDPQRRLFGRRSIGWTPWWHPAKRSKRRKSRGTCVCAT